MFIPIVSFLGLCFTIAFVYRRYSKVSSHTVFHKILREVKLSLSQEEWSIAEKKLEPLLNFKPQSAEVVLLQSHILRKTFRFKEAYVLLSDWTFGKSDFTLVCLERARIFYGLEKFEQSVTFYEKARLTYLEAVDTVETDLFFYLDALIKIGRYSKALEILDKLSFESQNRKLRILTGDLRFRFKRYQEAISCYESCIIKEYFDAEICLLKKLGHAYRLTKNYSKARMIFNILIRRDEGDEGSRLSLGLCEYYEDHYRKALLIFQSGNLWSLGHPILMKYGGNAAQKIHDYPLAEYCYGVAFDKGDFDLFSEQDLVSFGVVLEKRGRYRKAEEVYRETVKRFPGSYDGCLALARMFGFGIGFSILPEEGLRFVGYIVELRQDEYALEILSACKARIGDFSQAYKLQRLLRYFDTSREKKQRRYRILRHLRNQIPLDENHLPDLRLLTAA